MQIFSEAIFFKSQQVGNFESDFEIFLSKTCADKKFWLDFFTKSALFIKDVNIFSDFMTSPTLVLLLRVGKIQGNFDPSILQVFYGV